MLHRRMQEDLHIYIVGTRFIGALALAACGYAALRYGYRLYLDGVGLQSDSSTIEAEGVRIGLKNIGAGVLLTSVVWAGLSFYALPDIAYDDHGMPTIASADSEVEIHALREALKDKTEQIESMRRPLPAGTNDDALLRKNNELRDKIRQLERRLAPYIKMEREEAEREVLRQEQEKCLKDPECPKGLDSLDKNPYR